MIRSLAEVCEMRAAHVERRAPRLWRPAYVKGIGKFRAKIEAKWAVALTQAGIEWKYEPQTFRLGPKRYTPDFIVHGSVLIEVKASWPDDAERYIAAFEHEGLADLRCVLIVGPPRSHACHVVHEGRFCAVRSPFMRRPGFELAAHYAEKAPVYALRMGPHGPLAPAAA